MSFGFDSQGYDQSESEMLSVCCPQCDMPLTLHQPDEELVDRLLATCEACKSWFLANADASVLTPISKESDRSLRQ
jgi:hypothetical protein